MILHIKSSIGARTIPVSSFAEAAQSVRKFIDDNDLGAGCSSGRDSFNGATISSHNKKEKLATVSYNGRVWNLDGSELTI